MRSITAYLANKTACTLSYRALTCSYHAATAAYLTNQGVCTSLYWIRDVFWLAPLGPGTKCAGIR